MLLRPPTPNSTTTPKGRTFLRRALELANEVTLKFFILGNQLSTSSGSLGTRLNFDFKLQVWLHNRRPRDRETGTLEM